MAYNIVFELIYELSQKFQKPFPKSFNLFVVEQIQNKENKK